MIKPVETPAKVDDVVLTADNAMDVALKEFEAENHEEAAPDNPPAEDTETPPSEEEVPEEKAKPVEKTDEELLEAKAEELTDSEKERLDAVKKAIEAEETKLLEKPEAELNAEDKEKRATVVLKREAEEREEQEASISKYAEKKQITIEEARKIYESVAKIQKKHGKDPFELSRAVLEVQHLVNRKDEEIRAVKEQANKPRQPQSPAEWENVFKTRGIVVDNQVLPWEEGVERYRSMNKDTIPEDMESEMVLKLIAKDVHNRYEVYSEKQSAKQTEDANKKRTELLKAIPEADKQFAADVEELLKSVPNGLILEQDYDISNALSWARGKYYTQDKVAQMVKDAEIRGFNRGKAANGKIVTTPVGGGKPASGKSPVSLSPAEKERAWQMFPDAKDDKEAYENYADVMKFDKK